MPDPSRQYRLGVSHDWEISPLEASRIHEAVTATSRAFWPDPMFGFFARNTLREHLMMPNYIGAILTDALRHGEVDSIERNGRVLATASWLAPGDAPRSHRRELLIQLRCLPALVRGRNRLKALDLLSQMDKQHPREPHWYLALLGVDPVAQGQGIGAALLRRRLEICDSTEMPAYLETQKPENLPYYQRFGFTVRHTVAQPHCPTLWSMWRDPRPV